MSLTQTLLGRFPGLESDVPAAGGVADALEVGQVVDEDGAQLDGENLAENDLIEASEEAEVVEEGAEEGESGCAGLAVPEGHRDQLSGGSGNGQRHLPPYAFRQAVERRRYPVRGLQDGEGF